MARPQQQQQQQRNLRALFGCRWFGGSIMVMMVLLMVSRRQNLFFLPAVASFPIAAASAVVVASSSTPPPTTTTIPIRRPSTHHHRLSTTRLTYRHHSITEDSSALEAAASASSSATGTIPYRRRSFADRLRDTVLQQQHEQQRNEKQLHQQQKTSHIQEVTSIAELEQAVRGRTNSHHTTASATASVVAVQWHAPWCRACKRTVPAFAALHQKPNLNHANASVRYVSVSSHKAANSNLHAGFGIVSVPYGHIYHPTVGLVEELKLHTPVTFAAYEAILQSYVQGYCMLPSDVHAATGTYAAPYQRVS